MAEYQQVVMVYGGNNIVPRTEVVLGLIEEVPGFFDKDGNPIILYNAYRPDRTQINDVTKNKLPLNSRSTAIHMVIQDDLARKTQDKLILKKIVLTPVE